MATASEDIIDLTALVATMSKAAPTLKTGGLQRLYEELRSHYTELDQIEDIVGLQGFLQTTVNNEIIYIPLRIKYSEEEEILAFLALPKHNRIDFICEVDAEVLKDIFESSISDLLPPTALMGPVLLKKKYSDIDISLLQHVHIPIYDEIEHSTMQTVYTFIRGLLENKLTANMRINPSTPLLHVPPATQAFTHRPADVLPTPLRPVNQPLLRRRLTPSMPALTPQQSVQSSWNTGGAMSDLKTRLDVCLKMMGPLHNKTPKELGQKIALHSGQLDLISRDLNIVDFTMLTQMLLPPGLLGPNETFSSWAGVSAAIQERASGQSGVVDLSTKAKEVLKTSGILSAVDIIVANTATPSQVLDFLCSIIEDSGVKGALTMRLGYGFTTEDVKLAMTNVWRSFRMPLVPEPKPDKNKQIKENSRLTTQKPPQSHQLQQRRNPPRQAHPFFNNRWRDDRRGSPNDFQSNWNRQPRRYQTERFDAHQPSDHWQRNNPGHSKPQFSGERPQQQRNTENIKNKKPQAPEDKKSNKRIQENTTTAPSHIKNGQKAPPGVPDSTWA
ncbi:uncharacterized protein [Hyperolius riggenbachi]|uniref:uncharacterized protein isoform X2 n=1 Tax=Hyperolius riggenbachi TaxID=752182 RepID=UPI0035A3D0BC